MLLQITWFHSFYDWVIYIYIYSLFIHLLLARSIVNIHQHVTSETGNVDCPRRKYGLVHDRAKRGSRRQSIEMKSDCCLRGKSLCSLFQKPVIIASCLHKEYAGQKKRCFSRRRKKTAVRNISFCVKKGLEQSLLKFAVIFRDTHWTSRLSTPLYSLKHSFTHSAYVFWVCQGLFKNPEI